MSSVATLSGISFILIKANTNERKAKTTLEIREVLTTPGISMRNSTGTTCNGTPYSRPNTYDPMAIQIYLYRMI